ncbi:MAG: hypothetical protein IPN77_09425 [Sandaracinaceae bacterium]|nr:hypothetical protein [Sandaracinaceae bacterium]
MPDPAGCVTVTMAREPLVFSGLAFILEYHRQVDLSGGERQRVDGDRLTKGGARLPGQRVGGQHPAW